MSKWRKQYKVHPAADVFPMMSDEELAALGEDIKANGLRVPVLLVAGPGGILDRHPILIDGRNRLEAMERVGLPIPRLDKWGGGSGVEMVFDGETVFMGDPVAYIISLNIHRRHLTKQQQADLIVAALATAKPVQVEPVSQKVWIKSPCGTPLWETPFDTVEEFYEAARKGGRGKKNALKEKAVATGKEHGISESTIKRALSKADGKLPAPKPEPVELTLEIARKHYCEELVKLDSEEARSAEIAALQAEVMKQWEKRASTLPQDGRDPTPPNDDAVIEDDLEIPECLDRRKAGGVG